MSNQTRSEQIPLAQPSSGLGLSRNSLRAPSLHSLEENLKASEFLTQLVIEASHDSIQILDSSGHITFINARGLALMELDAHSSVLGSRWLDAFADPDREHALRAFHAATAGQVVQFQAFCPTLRGSPKWWSITLRPIPSSSQKTERLFVLSRDMTEHLQVEKALRESEEGFRKIFEEGPIGIVLADVYFEISKVNNALSRMLGYSEQELRGKHFSELVHPSEAFMDPDRIQSVMSGRIESFQEETQYVTRRKTMVWGLLTISVIRDPEGKPLNIVAMIENIDERKKAQERFLAYQDQLQSLASELSLSEERERRRIATGLHDRIGQTLAFAKLKLGALSQSPELNGHSELLQEIRELIEQSLADTRSLTFELSPPVLYELGLSAALEWLARRIQQDHGIHTRFHDDGQPKPLDDDLRIVLFQAGRELLVNVVKHARAHQVQVLLRRDSDALRIIIEDDGIGFEPAHVQIPMENAGFGLFSIRERLHYLGGQVKIRSEKGSGTRITLIAPLKLETTNPS